MQPIHIGDRLVGPGEPALVVAELSANHNQSLSLALETVAAAAECGADAIKLQTYTPETITLKSHDPLFRIEQGTRWDGRTLYDIYSEGQTPWEWHSEIFAYARTLGMLAFSSPFDHTAIDFLEALDVPAFKIASFEIVDIPLISAAASIGKPMILSTGIAELADIELALAACHEAGNSDIVVLKCTSSYPAAYGELNLRTMVDISQRFDCLVGISDHTMTNTAAVASIALGGCMIERHIVLDREAGGLDAGFSTNPAEFAVLVEEIRNAESALGEVTYELTTSSSANKKFARSLFIVEDVRAGDSVTSRNVRSIRPSDGMPPANLPSVLGKTFVSDLAAGTPLMSEHLATSQ
jgi:pseudaminic acid synthase